MSAERSTSWSTKLVAKTSRSKLLDATHASLPATVFKHQPVPRTRTERWRWRWLGGTPVRCPAASGGGGGGSGGGGAAHKRVAWICQRPSGFPFAHRAPPRTGLRGWPVVVAALVFTAVTAVSAMAAVHAAPPHTSSGHSSHVSRPFPSLNRSILTEIYPCHTCSYHEVEDGNGRAGGQRLLAGGRSLRGVRWRPRPLPVPVEGGRPHR